MRLARRTFLAFGAATAGASLLPRRLFAEMPAGRPLHGLSAFGDLKYPADFSHFEYVEPQAPKGGMFNFAPPNWLYNQNPLTFNTLNSFVMRGDAPPRMQLCFDTLMASALDEPDAVYGLLAETVTLSEDRNSYAFRLRPQARFHDGSPLTAEDVAFSYNLLKKDGGPDFTLPLADMVEAVADDDRTVRLVFSGKQSERAILTAVSFPIFSKADLQDKTFEASGLKPLLASGPYKVGRFAPGQWIEYERVRDYWGADLAVNRGQNNFDTLRIEFYASRQAQFEAFKKGEINYRQEFTSRLWATGYDFPALREGKVIKREFPSEKRPTMQAMALNQRRKRFQDVRVRRAIALCFDFEWTNRNLFYGLYERSQSVLERSAYRAEGLPSDAELALLEPLRGQIPDAAFGEAILQPVSNGSGRDRRLIGHAARLLAEAGWKRQGNVLRNADGEPLTVELLVNDEVFVQVYGPFVQNMRAIGINASTRLVDSAQYQLRLADFDYDLMSAAFSFTATPTHDEMENFFHSRVVSVSGSHNYPGVSSPAIDALIEALRDVKDRDSLTAVLRALDRVLRARLDWIPNWHSPNHRAAFWDMFGFKEPKPDFGFPVETLWWFDAEKARAIGKG